MPMVMDSDAGHIMQTRMERILSQTRMLTGWLDKCTINIKEPIIKRDGSHDAINIKNNLFIHPRIYLSKGDDTHQVTSIDYLSATIQDKFVLYPRIFFSFTKFFPVLDSEYEGLYRTDHRSSVDANEIVNQFLTPRVTELNSAIKQEWERVKISKNEYFEAYRKKHITKEIKRFAGKFKHFLLSHSGARELDNEFIYKIMNMDPKLIQEFVSFVRKNKTDLAFITLADLDPPKNEAIVESIMTK